MNPFKEELGSKGYVLWTAIAWAIVIVFGVIIDTTKNSHQGNYWLGLRVIIAAIFVGIYLLASFRRMQNTKYNPWWSLLILVPYIDVIVWLVLIFLPSKRQA